MSEQLPNNSEAFEERQEALCRQLSAIEFDNVTKLEPDLLRAALEGEMGVMAAPKDKAYKQITLGKDQAFFGEPELRSFWIKQGGTDRDKIPYLYNGSKKVYFHPTTGQKLEFE